MGETIKNTKTPVTKGCMMNDYDILNDIIISFKHLVCGYATALNEASNKNVYKLFFNAFENASKLQAELFECSFKKGWYTLESADEKKIENALSKFSKCASELFFSEETS